MPFFSLGLDVYALAMMLYGAFKSGISPKMFQPDFLPRWIFSAEILLVLYMFIAHFAY